jgi:hypothetical protein
MGAAMRSLDHQEVFLRHGVSGTIEPTRLNGSKILGLAADLRDLELARKNNAA